MDTIVGPDEACYFLFWANANDRITISMRSLDEDFYPTLELYTPVESLVTENDNSFSFNGQISEQILPSDGWYTIVAKPYNHEGAGRFTLILTKTE